MEKQDQLSDAQRDYVDTIRGGVAGSLSTKEYAYALDSFMNGTDVETVVARINADREETGVERKQDDPPPMRH